MKVVSLEKTDKGKIRELNEDFLIKFDKDNFLTKKYGKVFIVCDGIGGHLGGEVASKLASEKFIEIYYSDNIKIKNIKERIEYTLSYLNNEIFKYSQNNEKIKGMGTTIVGIILKNKIFYIFNIGDSKCFLIRRNKIIELSEEHTLINELIKNNFLDKEKLNIISKNIITRALGIDKSVKPFIKIGKFRISDRFILCSDGLLNHVKEGEILNIIKNKKIENKLDYLVNLANERGGSDNITIIYIYFKSLMTNLFNRR